MAVNSAGQVFLSFAATRINGITDQSFDEAISTIDVTTKDSSGNKEILADEFSASGSCTCLLDEGDTYTFAEIHTAMLAKTSVAFTYGKGIEVSGAELISGNCIITGLSRSDAKNSPSTFTVTFETTGAVTNGTSSGTLA